MLASGEPMRPLKVRVLAGMQNLARREHPHVAADARAAGGVGDDRARPRSQDRDIARARGRRGRSPGEPGVTMSRTPGATRRPATTLAATAKSSSVPLAQEPMKAWSILVPTTSPTLTELFTIESGSATSGSIAPRSRRRRSLYVASASGRTAVKGFLAAAFT